MDDRTASILIALAVLAGCAPIRTVLHNDLDVPVLLEFEGSGPCSEYKLPIGARDSRGLECTLDGISTVTVRIGDGTEKCTMSLGDLQRQLQGDLANRKGKRPYVVRLSRVRCPA